MSALHVLKSDFHHFEIVQMRVITTNCLPRLFRLTGRQQQLSRSICLSPVTWQRNRNQKDTKGQSPTDLTSAVFIGIIHTIICQIVANISMFHSFHMFFVY